MSKYKLLVILLMGVFLVDSCSENDLELSNPNQLSPDTFFSNESQVQSAINAAYANLQPFGLYGRLMFYMMDNMSHENAGNSQQEGDKVTFADFSFDSSNNQIFDYWDSCYRGINKANFIIGNADKINEISDSELSPARKRKFIGEARFLRAYYYWLLVNRFGGVPIRSGTAEDVPEGSPRSTKAEVINLIVEDLTFASANLLRKSEEDKGRATKGAAQAFLGKVLLYEKEYGAALDAFQAMSGYDLETDYYDNFKEETEHGIESVFEVEYDIALGTGAKWDSPVSGSGPNHATFRGQDYGVLNWFNVYPSDDLVAEFEPGDNRFQGSFYVPGDTYNNGQNTFVADDFAENGGNVRSVAWKKYQNYYKQTDEASESGINVKIIRYSDVLLMMAECENEVGTQADAIGLINRVRTRAGLANLPLNLSKAQVFDAIVHERKVELNGEQVRFDDMIRWGIVASELADTNFQAGKHELWPIPDREISSNANLTSADQNPGY
ncbi:RagB/SusD family nutrient uptake outer membrane protein [Maribacter polysiphoniae]|uniref:Putative outer membrane starch-binding protein n=1 Tax=Maribacter polysiphoniae TaxID=429344 RepID=A0A316DYK4_9FLAO|nr:RagB/SusD family nutrient uptake outer membrane protein [Maribacter polysiphoniae]MBD1261951.1 RagB/SusD family nutrient uptake outer membrane protein [Maribacter polysiphoniae]PWK22319.1 putative outer membrane starch-binding protein [Maribacter polysiphoniae]